MVYDDIGRWAGHQHKQEDPKEVKKKRRSERRIGWSLAGLLVGLDLIIQTLFVSLTTDNQNIWLGLVVGLLMLGVTLPSAGWIVDKMGNFSNQFKFWKMRGADWRSIAIYWLTLFAGSAAIGSINLFVHKGTMVSSNQAALQSLVSINRLPGLFVLIVIVGPIIEELLFRGVIMGYLLKTKEAWVRISVSGISFGLFHMANGLSVLAFIQYAFIGCVLAFIFWRKSRIQIPIIVHMAYNLFAFVPFVYMALQ